MALDVLGWVSKVGDKVSAEGGGEWESGASGGVEIC